MIFHAEQCTNTSSEYGTYLFTIQDNGIGMNPEFLPHIFEPFEREKNSSVRRIGGSGLGMTITKNLVEMMHGTISVESTVGKGTIVTICMHFRLQKVKQ